MSRKLYWRPRALRPRETMSSAGEGAEGQTTSADAATDLPGVSRLAECPAAGLDAWPEQGAAAGARGHDTDQAANASELPRAQAEKSAESPDLTVPAQAHTGLADAGEGVNSVQDADQRRCDAFEPHVTFDTSCAYGDAEERDDSWMLECKLYCRYWSFLCCIECLSEL